MRRRWSSSRPRGTSGRRIETTIAAALLLVVLTACSSPDAPEGGESPSPDAPSTTPPPAEDYTPTPDLGADVEELVRLAEELAADLDRIEPRDEPVLGADISWPQCPVGMGIPERRTQGSPMPIDAAEYVVVGLTNGPAFYVNPCLAEQVAWVTERELLISAYSVLSFPDEETLERLGGEGPYDGSTRIGALRNIGYQQAGFNIANMREADLVTPIVWLDVEPVSDWEWTADLAANAAVVEGAARGYRDAGYEIGVYSTPALWADIVGDYELGIPEWRAAGETSSEEALARCGDDWSIQGGEAVMGQWVELDRDQNLTCPGISADLGRWFHQT